jgi:hypothetical protein
MNFDHFSHLSIHIEIIPKIFASICLNGLLDFQNDCGTVDDQDWDTQTIIKFEC